MQEAFQEGRLEEEAMWQGLVLISKWGGEYRIIGLVEVVWKVVTVILNICFTASIAFHDVIHDFWEGRGTYKIYPEARMLH